MANINLNVIKNNKNLILKIIKRMIFRYIDYRKFLNEIKKRGKTQLFKNWNNEKVFLIRHEKKYPKLKISRFIRSFHSARFPFAFTTST